jgi:hypothetical protein
MFRVDVRSPGNFGDEELVVRIRKAVQGSALRQPSVRREEKRGEVVVEFNVDATGLDDAAEVGKLALSPVLADAGIEMPVEVVGTSNWLD